MALVNKSDRKTILVTGLALAVGTVVFVPMLVWLKGQLTSRVNLG